MFWNTYGVKTNKHVRRKLRWMMHSLRRKLWGYATPVRIVGDHSHSGHEGRVNGSLFRKPGTRRRLVPVKCETCKDDRLRVPAHMLRDPHVTQYSPAARRRIREGRYGAIVV